MIGKTRLLIPAGPCPSILVNSDYESVEGWINSIKKSKPEDKRYEPSVYRYWLIRHFKFGSEDYKEADKNISLILGTKARIFDLVDKRVVDEKG